MSGSLFDTQNPEEIANPAFSDNRGAGFLFCPVIIPLPSRTHPFSCAQGLRDVVRAPELPQTPSPSSQQEVTTLFHMTYIH
jgi:hypothetical protein